MATAGVAPALRAVDCLANEASANAFGRLFGGNGALLPALTLILTLYIAFFAISLLTGRSRIGLSALTSRMMTLGVVLTFATNWVAYQGVVWNLAIGAPDQVAGVLMGAKGSATELFARRIDVVVAAIADTAETTAVGQGPSNAVTTAAAGSFSPGNLMWLSALLLLLGTVGVLITARIGLAVLLILGPVFMVLALFRGTRGLFAGWIRGVVLTALAPLFVVLGGGFMLEFAIPVISGLRGASGIDGRAAMTLFLVAAVHIALMAMVLRVVGTMVGAWSVFGLDSDRSEHVRGGRAGGHSNASAVTASALAAYSSAFTARRSLGLFAPIGPSAAAAHTTSAAERSARNTIVAQVSSVTSSTPMSSRQRAQGVGSRFAAPARASREMPR